MKNRWAVLTVGFTVRLATRCGSRPDFADRIVHGALKPIAAAERLSEAEYWRDVENRFPLIFGAMLDAIAGALHNRGTTPPPVARMADFETRICAAEPALVWAAGEFIAAYTGNRQGTIDASLEADPLAEAVRQLVKRGIGRVRPLSCWCGSARWYLTKCAKAGPGPRRPIRSRSGFNDGKLPYVKRASCSASMAGRMTANTAESTASAETGRTRCRESADGAD
jgi:hypothetical protein